MKVLYIWDADYPWDIRVEKTCRSLVECGHEVHIAARNTQQRPTLERLREGRVHRMKPWGRPGGKVNEYAGFPAFFNPRWIRLITHVARHVQPDVLLVRDLPLCITAIWVGRTLGVPVVLDMAENYPAMIRTIWESGDQKFTDYVVRNPWVVERIERFCLARVDRVLVVVEESAQRLRDLGVPSERISIVSNTPRLDELPPARDVEREQSEVIDVAYVGIMELPRGIMDLLRALAVLHSDGQPFRLQLIGGGRHEPLFRAEANRLGLDERAVRFHGFLPHPDAMRCLSAAQIGVIPHVVSDFCNTTVPNKLFDYMALGLPVVSSDMIPCKRILDESGAGLTFRSGRPDDLARVLLELSDRTVRARFGAAGRDAVRSRFNWGRDFEVLETSLQGVCG